MKVQSTKDQAALRTGVKMLAYGQAGAGKTCLISTLPSPIILSAEGGLLSLRGLDLPYIEIDSIKTLKEAHAWLIGSAEADGIQSVALDSLSEIAEVCLDHEKRAAKDPRQAYMAMQDEMSRLIRMFRDLPYRHVYFSAKLDRQTDELGNGTYGPSMPGQKLGMQLPFFFDQVFALRVGKAEDGTITRALQCQPDGKWFAKDRSGVLGDWFEADLGKVIQKIYGTEGK